VVGSLLLEHAPSAPTMPSTKDKRLGQRACIERVAQGQRGGGMRVLGVCENWAGKCVLDFDFKRQTAVVAFIIYRPFKCPARFLWPKSTQLTKANPPRYCARRCASVK